MIARLRYNCCRLEKTISSADLQCSVDDALDLVHDVVLCEQMVEISVGREAGEVDGGSAEEAEDCVGGRLTRRARRLHAGPVRSENWSFLKIKNIVNFSFS